MGNLILTIKTLIERYIYNLYQQYLQDNNILLVKKAEIKGVIDKMYSENSKAIKQYVRTTLKHDMGQDYPSGSIENILLDIFQDREANILKLSNIIDDYQETNYMEIEKSINDNRLGLSIKFDGSFCMIGDNTNTDRDTDRDINTACANQDQICRYRYLYSINGMIINEAFDAISSIREIVANNNQVVIGLYRLLDDRNN